MAAYIVAQLKVHDPAMFQRYREAVTPLVDRFGGRYRVRGAELEVLEGDWPFPRLTIIEFQSRDAARLFYDSPEYQKIRPLRQKSVDGTVVTSRARDSRAIGDRAVSRSLGVRAGVPRSQLPVERTYADATDGRSDKGSCFCLQISRHNWRARSRDDQQEP